MVMQIIEKFDEEALIRYLIGLASGIPGWVYIILASSFLIGTIFFLIWKGVKKGIVLSVWLFLLDYIFLLVCSTIVFRQYTERKPVELRLFWSYKHVHRGLCYLFYENIMNIAVFIPIGIVLGILLPLSRWWTVPLIGLLMSVLIELMQLGFHRGLCELDDMIHNTVGCFIGLLIACLMKVVAKYLRKIRFSSLFNMG